MQENLSEHDRCRLDAHAMSTVIAKSICWEGGMHLKVLRVLSAALVLVTANPALSQAPGWAVGTWRGTLEAYRNDPWGAERVMVIEPSGRCRWFHASKAESVGLAKSCDIGTDTIELQTVAHSTVRLKYGDGKLRGQFITSAGKTHSITLSK